MLSQEGYWTRIHLMTYTSDSQKKEMEAFHDELKDLFKKYQHLLS